MPTANQFTAYGVQPHPSPHTNRIKEQQLYLFADRTSATTMRANQLPLWFSSVAYLLMLSHSPGLSLSTVLEIIGCPFNGLLSGFL